MRSREAAARALSRLAVLVLVVACTATNADRSPAPTESAPASAPARLTPTPTPTPVGYLVPVTGFMTLRDDFRLAELTDVLVPAGEMIFGRGVQWRIEDRYAGDSRPAFDKVRDVTKSATLAVATLEAPLSGAHNKYCDGCVVFVGNEAYISGISDAGIDVVTLAANHIGDGGPQGVLNTVRVLDSAHIAHVGAGADLAAAHRPAIVESGGGGY